MHTSVICIYIVFSFLDVVNSSKLICLSIEITLATTSHNIETKFSNYGEIRVFHTETMIECLIQGVVKIWLPDESVAYGTESVKTTQIRLENSHSRRIE